VFSRRACGRTRHNHLVAELPRVEIEWRVVNDACQVGFVGGAAACLLYTVAVSAAEGDEWLEFCWMPFDDPDQDEVLFGVSEAAGDAWGSRWDRAQYAAGWLQAEER
jgi:hypothetical protein